MTDLTDELTVGWHYIEHAKFSNHTIDFLYPTGDWKFSNKESVKKVIAPVPSYEELKELVEEDTRQKELIKRLGDDIDELDTKKQILLLEISSLRGLLQECRFEVDAYRETLLDYKNDFAESRVKEIQELLTKIEEAIK